MGIIAKQASRNAALILFGVVFGAVNNLFILPNAFEDFKEGWAFLGLALSIALISSQLFSFSSQSIFINRIPKLETEQQQNDLVSLVLMASQLEPLFLEVDIMCSRILYSADSVRVMPYL